MYTTAIGFKMELQMVFGFSEQYTVDLFKCSYVRQKCWLLLVTEKTLNFRGHDQDAKHTCNIFQLILLFHLHFIQFILKQQVQCVYFPYLKLDDVYTCNYHLLVYRLYK